MNLLATILIALVAFWLLSHLSLLFAVIIALLILLIGPH